jgi:4-carboxymuconolactone decarboxylase
MTETERALVLLSATIAGTDAAARERVMDRAHEFGPDEAEEVILQSYLFLGYPATLRAFTEWRARTGRPAPAAAATDADSWAERGERLCSIVYGGQYHRLRANIAGLHPDIEQWMVTEGYGKVLGRSGLPLRTRELCIIVLLAGQDAGAQLYSHMRGARHAGVSRADIEETLTVAEAVLPADRVAAARETLRRVLAREDCQAAREEESCS